MKIKEQMQPQFQFLKYLNLARRHPAYYVSIIERQIAQFSADGSQLPLTKDVYYQTNEGKQAWVEARDFLLEQKSLQALTKHQGLEQAARMHQKDLCQNGIFGHIGSNNSTFNQRILSVCKKSAGAMAELIGADFQFTGRNTPEMTVLSLIIDDGIKDRGHRKTLFSDTYRYIGWSSGRQDEKIITVFNMTENNLKIKSQLSTSSQTSISSKTKSTIQQYNNPNINLTPQWKDENKSILGDISNITVSNKQIESKLNDKFRESVQNNSKGFSFLKKAQKMCEKRQSNIIYYENGCKIMNSTTKFIYEDGRVEEYREKRTLFDGEASK